MFQRDPIRRWCPAICLFLSGVGAVLAEPWDVYQARKLIAHAERYGYAAGASVSIDGTTAAVGSPATSTDTGPGPTSIGEGLRNVFIFERDRYRTNEWGFVTGVRSNLLSAVPDAFGVSISLDGDRLAVGAPGDGQPGVVGKVYVCERHAGGSNRWGFVQELTAPGGGAVRDGFGTAVSLDKTNLVVGMIEIPDPDIIVLGPLVSLVLVYQRTGGVWSFTNILTGVPRSEDDRFGRSVALDGDTAVVGAPRDSNAVERVGAVYVFERNQGGTNNWGQVSRLQPVDLALSDEFGNAVAVSGSNLIAGAWRQDQPAAPDEQNGAAYLFRQMAGPSWTQIRKFTSPNPAIFGRYGSGVAIDGHHVAIGEPSTSFPGLSAPGLDLDGRAYVYERDQGGADQWGLVREIRIPNDETPNLFAAGVSVSSNTLLCGDPGDNKSGAGIFGGMAYAFEKNHAGSNQWGLVSRLIPTEYERDAFFGTAVAVDGDTMAVGMPFKDVLGVVGNGGITYIYERNRGGLEEWGLTVSVYSEPLLATTGAQAGTSLSISDDRLAVGARAFPGTNGMIAGSGAVFLHERNQNGTNQWGRIKTLTPADPGSNNNYGAAVALKGDVLVAGAPGKDTGAVNAGSIYVHFRHHLASNSWNQLGEIQATSPVAFAQFGSSLAFDNSTNLIVGAPFDNTDAALAGAAFILPLTGGQIRLPAVALSAQSFFGQSVDLDGEWAVVGAYGDADNGALAGAAYIFRRNMGGPENWGQFKKLKPSDGTTNQLFGWAVSLDGERLVVSARGDNSATNGAGALYTFGRDVGGNNNWGQMQKVVMSPAVTNANMGQSVALSGRTIVAGADQESIDGSFRGGAAYVFDELLAYIRRYRMATNGMHQLDFTLTPYQNYFVRRSTNSLVTWTNYTAQFIPSNRFHTTFVPGPTNRDGAFRLLRVP